MFDVAAFYTKWMTDLADAQRPNGSIPDVSPNYWPLYNDTSPGRAPSSSSRACSTTSTATGACSSATIRAMKKWIDYMRDFVKDGLMPKDTYGDWCVPPEDPKLIHSKDPARRPTGRCIGDRLLLRAAAG